MIRRPPRSTLFPSRRLFRAHASRRCGRQPHGFADVVLKTLVDVAVDELAQRVAVDVLAEDRKSTRLNSSHANISYAVFCLKKKSIHIAPQTHRCSAITPLAL